MSDIPKLTERQWLVLKRLAGRNVERDGAETGREIAAALWSWIFTSHEQGQRTCKQLEAKGLATKLGKGFDNAATWTATAEGRRVVDITMVRALAAKIGAKDTAWIDQAAVGDFNDES